MQYVKIIFFFVVIVLGPQLLGTLKANAVSQNIVIAQVQLGGAGSGAAGQEFVEIYNNSYNDVDVTGWCLTYVSASGSTTNSLYCVRPNDAATKIWLKAQSYAMFVSQDMKSATGRLGDGTLTYRSGIASTGGRIKLFDMSNIEIDQVVWGAVQGDSAAPEPAGGKVLQRTAQGVMKDTDNSSADFIVSAPSFNMSGLYEVVADVCPNIAGAKPYVPAGLMIDTAANCVAIPPADVCPNIPELQVNIPEGYMHDENGNCQVDSCTNLDGLQLSIPRWYSGEGSGYCAEQDVCLNLDGAQYEIPDGYVSRSTSMCYLDLVALKLSEILPNPKGVDTGKEFIEIYNPSDRVVSLEQYVLETGVSLDKMYSFPASASIGPGEYGVYKDSDLGFVLTNASGRVALRTIDGVSLDDTGVYTSAAENMAWAMVGGVWQFTDIPTPGAVNAPLQAEDVSEALLSKSIVTECPAGKYRNSLTNRCRTIESDASVLAICESGQYRNPETGRCKKIVNASAATPCKDGQYRSEETNRCRNISTANAALAPCKQGQERHPDTNRCRTVAAPSIPAAAYAVEPVKDGIKAFVGWWAVGGVGILALGYAGWEWRREVAGILRRFVHMRVRK